MTLRWTWVKKEPSYYQKNSHELPSNLCNDTCFENTTCQGQQRVHYIVWQVFVVRPFKRHRIDVRVARPHHACSMWRLVHRGKRFRLWRQKRQFWLSVAFRNSNNDRHHHHHHPRNKKLNFSCVNAFERVSGGRASARTSEERWDVCGKFWSEGNQLISKFTPDRQLKQA